MTSFAPSHRILVIGFVRVAAVLVALMGLGFALDFMFRLPRYFGFATSVTGLGLLVGGAGLEAWATRTFWREGGGTPHPRDPPRMLVTSGPFRFSRNPMYVSRLALLGGTAALFGSVGILLIDALLSLGLQFVLIPREEGRLEARFGSAYMRYRERVPRWLWPPFHRIPRIIHR